MEASYKMFLQHLLIISLLGVAYADFKSFRRPLQKQNRPIVGGENADISNFPHQVSLGRPTRDEEGNQTTRHFCGGSVISVDWVLTAAHCLFRKEPKDVLVRVGSTIRGQGGYLHEVDYLLYHSGFTYEGLDFDVAVLKVTVPFEIGPNVKPITLNRNPVLEGSIAIVSGWGVINETFDIPTILQKVEIPIIPHWECKLLYAGKITENMICAGRARHSACYGDSGGAITIDGIQIGIVSWGESCFLPNHPGVYANVATLRDWIRKYTGV